MRIWCIPCIFICVMCILTTFNQVICMKSVIFREYDIRGKVGSELIVEEVYDLTRAIAYYFLQHNSRVRRVAVGMDGRTHSPAIKDEVCRALRDSGLDILFVGMCTSPALYFALYTEDVDAALMITASHNPKEYNGLKICLGKDSVWGAAVHEIETLYRQKKQVTSEKTGEIVHKDIVPRYIDWLVEHFSHLKNIALPIIIDCGNGAAGLVIPTLIDRMGWQHVQQLYCDVDGTYPNHEADPVKESNMQEVKQRLQTTDAVLGIGLDGDADRMAPMTKEGVLVPGDLLLTLFAREVLAHNAGAAIVFDIKSSLVVSELITQWGGKPIVSPSGHAIIKDEMKKHSALLGGELSCHFFFKDRYFGYDDGIYALLRLVELLHTSSQSLSDMMQIFPQTYASNEVRLACAEEDKKTIVDAVRIYFEKMVGAKLLTIDGVRVEMPYGWGIVRPSNTQSVLSMRFESRSQEGLAHIKKEFYTILSRYFDTHVLSEELKI